jgi:hypothetical protein
MCGTLNAKNGATVLGQVFDPTPWSFHDLCDEILSPRPEPKARVLDLSTAKAARGQRIRTGSIYDWWHLVYRDLLAIAEKHWFGGIPEGHRDQFLFLSSVALSWFAHTDTLEDELTRRARTWTPGLKVSEVRDAISPAIQRAHRAAAGEKVLFNGEERDPRYWYKRETLHGLMEPLIDAELAPTLRAIIPAEVRQERRQARDAARYEDHYTGQGVKASNEQQRATARILRAQGKSLRVIAAELGVSLDTACRWVA